ncbi:MAG: hypothetical protein FJ190_05385 [Gammaproteobacteria bacterium]|nr:hypothetical protein [Gammaproteobacteria bacterium]
MALHFDYALRLRSNSVKTPGLYGYAGVVVHRSASLASMYSFSAIWSFCLIRPLKPYVMHRRSICRSPVVRFLTIRLLNWLF